MKDAIYICNRVLHRTAGTDGHPTYHRTRMTAMEVIHAALDQALVDGENVFLGFDFGFGYPAGFAERLTGRAEALAVWDWLDSRITDDPMNANNRFEVASEINTFFAGTGPFWGCPAGRETVVLPAKGSLRQGHGVPDRRFIEEQVRTAQSGFKLFTTGSVGSQSLLGLPYLARLRRRYGSALTVWPQQSGWGVPNAQIVLAEIYPSLMKVSRLISLQSSRPNELYHIPDAIQVRNVCDMVEKLTQTRLLSKAFEPALGVANADRIAVEEGWIFGAGFGKRVI